MKLSKPFLSILVIFSIFWIAPGVQGRDQAPQSRPPRESFFSQAAFAHQLYVLEPGYYANLFLDKSAQPSFLRTAMEMTAQQAPSPASPTINLKTDEIKKGGSDRQTRQSSPRGYFWDVSGRINNYNHKKRVSDLVYKFGHTTMHFYLGYDKPNNNGESKVGVDNSALVMFGASLDYKVADTLYLIPLFTFYDWSKQPNIASNPNINQEWIGGLQLRFLF